MGDEMPNARARGKGKPKEGHTMIATYVYLTPEQWDWMHAEAVKRDVAAAAIVREAIDAKRAA